MCIFKKKVCHRYLKGFSLIRRKFSSSEEHVKSFAKYDTALRLYGNRGGGGGGGEGAAVVESQAWQAAEPI